MPRGGYRENAGGKPTWKHGKTKTIRVPVALAEQIINYARKLDEGSITEDETESKVLDLSGVIIPEIRNKRFVFLSDLAQLGYELLPPKLTEIVRAEMGLSSKKVVSRPK